MQLLRRPIDGTVGWLLCCLRVCAVRASRRACGVLYVLWCCCLVQKPGLCVRKAPPVRLLRECGRNALSFSRCRPFHVCQPRGPSPPLWHRRVRCAFHCPHNHFDDVIQSGTNKPYIAAGDQTSLFVQVVRRRGTRARRGPHEAPAGPWVRTVPLHLRDYCLGFRTGESRQDHLSDVR